MRTSPSLPGVLVYQGRQAQSLAPDSWLAAVLLTEPGSPEAEGLTWQPHSGPQFPHLFRQGLTPLPPPALSCWGSATAF